MTQGGGEETGRTEETPAPERPTAILEQAPAVRRRSAGRIAVGLFLILLGAGWFIDSTGLADLRWDLLVPAALTATGAALVLGAYRARPGGLILLGALLTVWLIAMPGTAVRGNNGPFGELGVEDGIGERVESPDSVDELEPDYRHATGQLTIDLTDLDLPARTTALRASVGIGELVVVVPEDLPVRVRARSGAGEITLFGREQSGAGVEETLATEEFEFARRRLDLRLSVGLGSIEVKRG